MKSAAEKLPEEFITRMQGYLPEDAEAFFSIYDRPPAVGIRLNTTKFSPDDLPFSLRQVPWTENGYYMDKDAPAAKHPYFFAGGYYIQEPSAMFPAAILPVSPGDLILDLCAAPGGKATELSLRLKGRGLLIANDASASRAKALLKNLTLWGASNSCITAETPERLQRAFGPVFDKILVDAPCSGEGMFRRDPRLIKAWEKKRPAAYVPLQEEILSSAVQMLKPGGMLLYSTCTFSGEEDEGVVLRILRDHPELTLIKPVLPDGISRGRGEAPLDRCVRLYPHRIEGEGQFAALFLKRKEPDLPVRTLEKYAPAEIRASRGTMPDAVRDFLKHLPGDFLPDYRYEQIGSQCLLTPPFQLPKLRYLRTGLLLGSIKDARFLPSQALASLLTKDEYDAVLDLPLSDQRLIRYLKGETTGLKEDECAALQAAADGWVLICVNGRGLGWGKRAGAVLKNKYEPGWRMQ